MIELVATNGGSTTACMRLNDENLLLELGNASPSYLLTAEAILSIDHKDKSYSAKSYEELQASMRQRVDKIAKSQDTLAFTPDCELRFTAEADTICGFKVLKLVQFRKGKPEAEIWVNTELLPAKLTTAGKRLRLALPEDYFM